MILLKGDSVVKKYKEKIRQELKGFSKKPRLVIIDTSQEEDVSVFIKKKIDMVEELGIRVDVKKFRGGKGEFRSWINKLSHQESIDGLILQLPLREDLKGRTRYFLDAISEEKDIDCLGRKCLGRLVSGASFIKPPVVEAIMSILDFYNIDIEGKTVVVVGRGKLVGKPLVTVLLDRKAHLIIPVSTDPNIKDYTLKGDIVISAVGRPGEFQIQGDMIKNAVLIDAGWGRLNGKIQGDFDFESVKGKAKAITPVPGGIGPVTVILLLHNLLKLSSSS